MTDGCKIVGPYLPVGDTDWECRTHDVLAELRDTAPTLLPDESYRREHFRCPVGEPS